MELYTLPEYILYLAKAVTKASPYLTGGLGTVALVTYAR